MTTNSTARLFVGLFPDNVVRDQLAAWRDAWTWPRSATPVAAGRLHLTLHFIGDVEIERVPEIAAALPGPFSSFALQLDRALLWPHGVAVLEPEHAPAALIALHAATGAMLQRLGLPRDARPYRPHVTLARRAAGAGPPPARPAIAWSIDRYALMQSTLGPGGQYSQVREIINQEK